MQDGWMLLAIGSLRGDRIIEAAISILEDQNSLIIYEVQWNDVFQIWILFGENGALPIIANKYLLKKSRDLGYLFHFTNPVN